MAYSSPRYRVGLRDISPLSTLLLTLTLTLNAPAALGIDLEKLVMPGPLAEDHAELESDCGNCHQAFESRAENTLCIDCHSDVDDDRKQAVGFHGRNPAAVESRCRSCHSEHKGRTADIVGLDIETFDHDFSDFRLQGAHQNAPCSDCHASGSLYREAPGDCASCHSDDDAHAGRLGTQCADCHVDRGWRETSFDHDETAFPLKGSHRKVACGLCHANEQYENTATDCNSCHRQDDRHRGRFGTRCESCHESAEWSRITFDHGRDTEFALDGAHRDAACGGCHRGILYQEDLTTDCYSCHRTDDRHRGRNGTKCQSCHSPASWQTSTFDHDRETDFPLRGSHRELACEGCHSGPADRDMDSSCVACHAGDDVHRGQQDVRCDRCHNENGWGTDVFFDHDLSQFPLLGLHAVVACEQCHLVATYKDAEKACVACHQGDDHHQTRLSTSCEQCHTPNGWRLWRFDHDSQTDFALHGAHEDVGCETCHQKPMAKRVVQSTKCFSCHSKDDGHYGSYGRECGRCHSDASWTEVEVFR